MRLLARLALIAAAFALLASWATLGRSRAATAPAAFGPGAYLPLVARPALATLTPTRTATPTATLTHVPAPPTQMATATRTTGPTPTPTLPPADFVSCSVVGNVARAPNYPLQIVGINKVAETVTLRNVSGAAVDLTGWRMCSVTGGQNHGLSGSLAAGQTQTFPSQAGGPIWNNSTSDPGALWTPEGSLVSYWPD